VISLEIVIRLSIGVILGLMLGQKEMEQLYREYKESKKEVE
jgi:hypothetical protein